MAASKHQALTLLVSFACVMSNCSADEPKTPKVPTFDAPEGWKKLDAGPIASARFEIRADDRVATMTLTRLKGDGGGLAANVRRWRGKLGLEPIGDKEALAAVQEIKIDGLAAHRFDLTGPGADNMQAQSIVATFVRRGDDTWHFTLSGPAGLVAGQKAGFEKLLKSVRFPK